MSTYQIADLTVRYVPQFPMLRERSEKYRVSDAQEALFLTGIGEAAAVLRQEYPHLTPEECEYIRAGSIFYNMLLDHAGMMLHASAVVVDGLAYLFSAPSGTGKSTHTALWLQKFGSRAFLLNDDKPAIRVTSDGLFVYGTPFSGKFDYNVNTRAPLRGIAFVERDTQNSITRKTGKDALYALLNQTIRPGQVEKYTKLLQIVQQITRSVPIYTLRCNMEPDAATLSYETMRKGNEHED